MDGISSGNVELEAEFFRVIDEIDDMRLKSLLVLESFFSFFAGFSSLLSKL